MQLVCNGSTYTKYQHFQCSFLFFSLKTAVVTAKLAIWSCFVRQCETTIQHNVYTVQCLTLAKHQNITINIHTAASTTVQQNMLKWLTLSIYRIYPAIRQGFLLSRMTTNN